MDWFVSSFLVLPCYSVTVPKYPLMAYIDDTTYKLFLSDTGIINNMVGVTKTDILSSGDYDFKGVIAENYVATKLIKLNNNLFYWSRKNDNTGISEIDFVIQNNKRIVPIEVKAGVNIKSKSLEVFNDKFNPLLMIRISAKNFGMVGNLKSIPLYAVFCLKDLNI